MTQLNKAVSNIDSLANKSEIANKAADFTKKAGDSIEKLGDQIEHKYSKPLGDLIETIGDKVEHVGDGQFAEMPAFLKNTMARVRRQPVAYALGAIAIGYVASRVIKATLNKTQENA